jgi:hypothetical protein
MSVSIRAEPLNTCFSTSQTAGAQFGTDLARALFLVLSRERNKTQELKARLAQLVLREIQSSVQDLRDGGTPDEVAKQYDVACRAACRAELFHHLEFGLQIRRAA